MIVSWWPFTCVLFLAHLQGRHDDTSDLLLSSMFRLLSQQRNQVEPPDHEGEKMKFCQHRTARPLCAFACESSLVGTLRNLLLVTELPETDNDPVLQLGSRV